LSVPCRRAAHVVLLLLAGLRVFVVHNQRHDHDLARLVRRRLVLGVLGAGVLAADEPVGDARTQPLPRIHPALEQVGRVAGLVVEDEGHAALLRHRVEVALVADARRRWACCSSRRRR
jgi:hypothetical protein